MADRCRLEEAGADAAARARRPEVRQDLRDAAALPRGRRATSSSSPRRAGCRRTRSGTPTCAAHPDTRGQPQGREEPVGPRPDRDARRARGRCGRGWSSSTPTSPSTSAGPSGPSRSSSSSPAELAPGSALGQRLVRPDWPRGRDWWGGPILFQNDPVAGTEPAAEVSGVTDRPQEPEGHPVVAGLLALARGGPGGRTPGERRRARRHLACSGWARATAAGQASSDQTINVPKPSPTDPDERAAGHAGAEALQRRCQRSSEEAPEPENAISLSAAVTEVRPGGADRPLRGLPGW